MRKTGKKILYYSICVFSFVGVYQLFYSMPSKKGNHVEVRQELKISVPDIRSSFTTSQKITTEKMRVFNARYKSNNFTTGSFMSDLLISLPHLRGRPEFLQPRISISLNRTNAFLVIGIPTIKRPKEQYVKNTIASLLENLNESDKEDVYIVVCITEVNDSAYTESLIQSIVTTYQEEINTGLLAIISPKKEFYPNMDKLRENFGDDLQRVKWRSKQNLDYAFLMYHAHTRGMYYLQLEDDVIAAKNYLSVIRGSIENIKSNWIILQFSLLGYIGRLFKQESAGKMLLYLIMFYDAKPCDWLLDNYIATSVCGHIDSSEVCVAKSKIVSISVLPSIFQHQGQTSSLAGNKNDLKDLGFMYNSFDTITRNPEPVFLFSTFSSPSKKYNNLMNMYDHSMLYWGAAPVKGDVITFYYEPAVNISGIFIGSASTRAPSDLLTNTTIEISPEITPSVSTISKYQKATNFKTIKQLKYEIYKSIFGRMEGGYFVLDELDHSGHINVTVPKEFGATHAIRLRVQQNIHHWVTLQKIKIYFTPIWKNS